MSTAAVHHHDHQHETDSKVYFGFWVYILSDCILFASLFACYVVLQHNTFGGVGIRQIASLPYVLVETFLLLASSLTCGLGFLALHNRSRAILMTWLGVTFILGLCFLLMEWHEFSYLVHTGNSWQRSAFLSAFFTLVGGHGAHVFFGLIWLVVLFIQLGMKGITPIMKRRVVCFSLFWHFLDIVWIFIFTIVYLMGAVS